MHSNNNQQFNLSSTSERFKIQLKITVCTEPINDNLHIVGVGEITLRDKTPQKEATQE
jgi:hypothetical protein